MNPPPVALTIAGSDPGGGAGIQADLKTFSALGAYGTSVITALTAQNTCGVTGVLPIPVDFVRAQWRTLVADIRLDAIKIGMLASAELAQAVGDFLDERRCAHVVLDPVMVATSGDRLLDPAAIGALRRLLPRASLVTPNLPEAAALLDASPARSVAEMAAQAQALVAAGAQRALVKGGHLADAAESTDVLAGPEGVRYFRSLRVATTNTHGTGCTLSSALAALRPRCADWPATIAAAKHWLDGALRAADGLAVGHGHGPVHHFHECKARWT